ncbi:MAG: serine--tRNA ligase [Rickettsiales bacterium]|nr:serine--tRNA ligase [Rickettsiales bacterium]
MLDIKFIRENPEKFDFAMQSRGNNIKASQIIDLDIKNRAKMTKIQELQAIRNNLAKEIAEYKKQQKDTSSLLKKSISINQELSNIEKSINENNELEALLLTIPNLLDEEVKIGKDENENEIVEVFGKIPEFDFAVNSHDIIGEGLEMLDFEQSTLISGARFSTLTGMLAKIERALSNFMLDIANEYGYLEVSPPNLVKSSSMVGAGQLPKFAEDAFKTNDDYWLIPTAEVSLVNLVAKKILPQENLPLRFVAYTPCFRREAGSAGRDTKGMIRQHQFKKVELVSITDPEKSREEHERMTNIACEILKRLELPFRKIALCSGDTGFASQKTFDLEVWLPSQNKYREISSCSNCGDFQARRIGAKYKDKNSQKNYFVHTLNGSALAVGRTIVAILENYQNADGSVTIPKALRSYIDNIEKITK